MSKRRGKAQDDGWCESRTQADVVLAQQLADEALVLPNAGSPTNYEGVCGQLRQMLLKMLSRTRVEKHG